ncbi:hypothetical protein BGX28_007922 [Mortierella sp. GBA30]|nr:hypothetical protein BGX28_007922 [Mortierella sp. GBA30]
MHPLELPEIAAQFQTYLWYPEIYVCLQVCKKWHATYVPFLYEVVFLRNDAGLWKAPLSSIQKHAHFVRRLFIARNITIEQSNLVFPHLTHLSFERHFSRLEDASADPDNASDPKEYFNRLATIVKNHPAVHTINIVDSNMPYSTPTEIPNTPSVFWKTLAKHPTPLKRFSVLFMHYDDESFEPFWTVCQHAENLGLSGSEVSKWPQHKEQLRFPITRKLSLSNALPIQEQLLYIIARCPNLESLDVFPRSGEDLAGFMTGLASLMRGGCLPKLKNMTQTHRQLHDESLASFLEAMEAPRLERLLVGGDAFGPQSFATLQAHYPTITELELKDSHLLTGEMNQQILKSCPSLKTYRGTKISSADILEGPHAGPWVCLNIDHLELCIDMEVAQGQALRESEQQQRHERGVMEQLSKLTRLKSLDLCFNADPRQSFPDGPLPPRQSSAEVQEEEELEDTESTLLICRARPLSFKLGDGLELLDSLKRLQFVTLPDTWCSVGVKEVYWMYQNWRSLVSIKGYSLFGGEARERLLMELCSYYRVPGHCLYLELPHTDD